MKHYDVICIGTGPAGQKGAIQAAKLGRTVAVIEKNPVVGGAQVNTGTIPSKALREAVITLTGSDKRNLLGSSYRAKKDVTVADLVGFAQQIIRHEWELIGSQFERNNVDLIWGHAKFVGPNELEVEGKDGPERYTADKFLISGRHPPGAAVAHPIR